MADAPGAVGGAVVSRAQDWKDPIGRIGLVGQGVVATIIGLLAIRIAMGEKDEAATSEGAVAWLADQPLGKFLLVALTVALFALAVWRFLCALMGDPVEGNEPKDRLKYAVLGVIYLLLAITTLGVTIANWTSSGDTAGSEQSGDEGSQKAASTLFDWPAGRWLVGILGVAVIGYAGYNFHKQVIKKTFADTPRRQRRVVDRPTRAGRLHRAVPRVRGGRLLPHPGRDRVQVDYRKGAFRRVDRTGRHDRGQGAAVDHRDRAVRLRRLLHRRGQVPKGGMTQGGRRQTSRSGRESGERPLRPLKSWRARRESFAPRRASAGNG